MGQKPLRGNSNAIQSVDATSWRDVHDLGPNTATVVLSLTSGRLHSTLVFRTNCHNAVRSMSFDDVVSLSEMTDLLGTDFMTESGNYQIVPLASLFYPGDPHAYSNPNQRIAYASITHERWSPEYVKSVIEALNNWIKDENHPKIVYGHGFKFAYADGQLLESLKSSSEEELPLTCSTYILLILKNVIPNLQLLNPESWPDGADGRRLSPSELVAALRWHERNGNTPCNHCDIQDSSKAHEEFMIPSSSS